MSRHSTTRRLRALASSAGVAIARMHPHMLRPTYVTTMLDAGVDLRDVQVTARHADPRTTMRYDNSRELHLMGEPNTSFRGVGGLSSASSPAVARVFGVAA